jgi:hypothetical protein
MMNGKWMQQNHGKPVAGRFVAELNVITADLHGDESVYYYKIRIGGTASSRAVSWRVVRL